MQVNKILNKDEQYMARCLDLAQRAYNNAAPNPMVGAVLVYEDRIIGEGYHEQYGQAHAEVNCINSVKEEDKALIPQSTLYVSLEPCSFHGNTPACSQLIIREHILKVVIACLDPHPKVSGQGVAQLEAEGIEVIHGILEKEALYLNRRAFTSYIEERPYICLKWAATKNGFMAPADRSRKMISNTLVRYKVHDWRRQYHSIMVGYTTAQNDNPQLDNRYWEGGKNPIRIVIDPENALSPDLHLFDAKTPTIIFNKQVDSTANDEDIRFVKMSFDKKYWPLVFLQKLHELKIQSVFIEGGAKTLKAFLDLGLWDEIIEITGHTSWDNGIPAPQISQAKIHDQFSLDKDLVTLWKHERNHYIL